MDLIRVATCALGVSLAGALATANAIGQTREPPALEMALDAPVRVMFVPTARAQCQTRNTIRQRGAWQSPQTTTTRADTFVAKESGRVVFGAEITEGKLNARVMFPLGVDGKFTSDPPIVDANNTQLQEVLTTLAPSLKDNLGAGVNGETFIPGTPKESAVDPCRLLGATRRPGSTTENLAVGYLTHQSRKALLLRQTVDAYCATSDGHFDMRGKGWWLIDMQSGITVSTEGVFTVSSRGTMLAEVHGQNDCMIVPQ